MALNGLIMCAEMPLIRYYSRLTWLTPTPTYFTTDLCHCLSSAYTYNQIFSLIQRSRCSFARLQSYTTNAQTRGRRLSRGANQSSSGELDYRMIAGWKKNDTWAGQNCSGPTALRPILSFFQSRYLCYLRHFSILHFPIALGKKVTERSGMSNGQPVINH